MKITKLPKAEGISGGEVIPVVQGDKTKQIPRDKFLGQRDWNCADENSPDHILNQPFHRYEKEVDYTRLTLDKTVDELVAPGIYSHGSKIGLVADTEYTVDIISADETITLQLTAIDISDELGFPAGSIICVEHYGAELSFTFVEGVTFEDVNSDPQLGDDAVYFIESETEIQSIKIHDIPSIEVDLKKLPTKFIRTEDFFIPKREVITVSNDDFPIQPTITEASLNPAFECYPNNYYIVVNANSSTGTFQLALSITSQPINQVFYLPKLQYRPNDSYHHLSEGTFVEFSKIGADWKMRLAGVESLMLKKPEGYDTLDISICGKSFVFKDSEYDLKTNAFYLTFMDDTDKLTSSYNINWFNGIEPLELNFLLIVPQCFADERKFRICNYKFACKVTFGEEYFHFDGNMFSVPTKENNEKVEKMNLSAYQFLGFSAKNKETDLKPTDTKYLSIEMIMNSGVIPNGTEIILNWSK